MLYHLFNLLKDVNFPGHHLVTFLSFRAIAAVVISMLFAFFAGGAIIRRLQKAQIGETIRDLGLEGQMQKKGTPTMGDVIIIASLLVSALLVCDLSNIYVQLLLLTTVWCGGIGFTDDYAERDEKLLGSLVVLRARHERDVHAGMAGGDLHELRKY